MKRRHAVLATVAVGLSALAGTFAVTQTAALGQQPSQPSDAQIAARTAKADTAQAELDRIRALRVPALPAVPAAAHATLPQAFSAPVARPSDSHGDDEERGEGSDGHGGYENDDGMDD